VFIDEIDALGSRDRIGSGTSSLQPVQVLNTFLAMMDGVEQNTGVLFVAATNRLDAVDAALLRPGRFTRQIEVPVPRSPQERETLVRLRLSKSPVGDTATLSRELARIAPGMSPAEITDMVSEGLLLAARRGKDPTLDDFVEARNLVRFGAPKLERRPDACDRSIALHEAGHAVVAMHYSFPIVQVTIVGRDGQAGFEGLVERDEDWGMVVRDRESVFRDIDVLLGGRCAESLCGAPTTGCHHDLEAATRLATSIVARWGLDEESGLAVIEIDTSQLPRIPRVWRRVNALLRAREAEVEKILRHQCRALGAVRDALAERRTLFADEVRSLWGQYGSS
jgi:cell division protease FtsH